MAWFKRKDKKVKIQHKKEIPDGLWEKCYSCNEVLYKPELDKNLSVCHHCQHHFRIEPKIYVNLLLDQGTENRVFNKLESKDFLSFKAIKDYDDQLMKAKIKTGEKDGIMIYTGEINKSNIVLGIMNFNFIGGSMGSVIGEGFSRAITLAGKNNIPFILICASGGARMQEGAVSLMQLAKTSAHLSKFSNDGGLFIPILTDPTFGGVTASFGMLGDIILAEPGALIGFAGPRVIKQTIGQELPNGFQKSEFLLKKGFIDQIVPRKDMKNKLSLIIKLLKQ